VQKCEGKEGVDEADEERDEDGEDSSVTHNSGLAVTHERDGESPEVDNGPKANNPSKPKSTPRSIQAILASASTTPSRPWMTSHERIETRENLKRFRENGLVHISSRLPRQRAVGGPQNLYLKTHFLSVSAIALVLFRSFRLSC